MKKLSFKRKEKEVNKEEARVKLILWLVFILVIYIVARIAMFVNN